MSKAASIFSKILGLFIFAGIIVLIALSGEHPTEADHHFVDRSKSIEIDENIRSLFPEATALKTVDTSYVEVYNQDDLLLGYLLYTSPHADHVYGFAGATPLLIGLDSKQTIVGTVLLPNSETHSYVNRITREGFLENWNGLSVKEALNKDVDAISGATLSTNAIAKSVTIRLSVYENRSYSETGKTMGIVQNMVALLVIAWAVFAYFNPKKCKKTRIALLGVSIIVLGFWEGKFLSLATFHAWITHGLPSFAQWVLILMVLISFLLPFFFGKHFYCTWLCPFGAVQEIAGKISKKKIKLPRKFYDTRRYYLFIIIFLILIGVVTDLANFEPFSAFMVKSASAFALILAGVFTILSVFIHKPWCQIFCPTGQLLEFARSFSVKNLKK